jgi:hypothetical protein
MLSVRSKESSEPQEIEFPLFMFWKMVVAVSGFHLPANHDNIDFLPKVFFDTLGAQYKKLEAENAELKQKLEAAEADYLRRHKDAVDRYEALIAAKATIESLNLRVARLVEYIKSIQTANYEQRRFAVATCCNEALSSESDSQWLREKMDDALEEVQMMFIKWYVSEREARFVFASTEKRDEFVKLMIGASELRNPSPKES